MLTRLHTIPWRRTDLQKVHRYLRRGMPAAANPYRMGSHAGRPGTRFAEREGRSVDLAGRPPGETENHLHLGAMVSFSSWMVTLDSSRIHTAEDTDGRSVAHTNIKPLCALGAVKLSALPANYGRLVKCERGGGRLPWDRRCRDHGGGEQRGRGFAAFGGVPKYPVKVYRTRARGHRFWDRCFAKASRG